MRERRLLPPCSQGLRPEKLAARREHRAEVGAGAHFREDHGDVVFVTSCRDEEHALATSREDIEAAPHGPACDGFRYEREIGVLKRSPQECPRPLEGPKLHRDGRAVEGSPSGNPLPAWQHRSNPRAKVPRCRVIERIDAKTSGRALLREDAESCGVNELVFRASLFVEGARVDFRE